MASYAKCLIQTALGEELMVADGVESTVVESCMSIKVLLLPRVIKSSIVLTIYNIANESFVVGPYIVT